MLAQNLARYGELEMVAAACSFFICDTARVPSVAWFVATNARELPEVCNYRVQCAGQELKGCL